MNSAGQGDVLASIPMLIQALPVLRGVALLGRVHSTAGEQVILTGERVYDSTARGNSSILNCS